VQFPSGHWPGTLKRFRALFAINLPHNIACPRFPCRFPCNNQKLDLTPEHALKQRLQGDYGYFGITGNFSSLLELREHARKTWKRWLSRRGRGGFLSWTEMLPLEKRYALPLARVVHSLLGGAAT
jgi:hypothetical protein